MRLSKPSTAKVFGADNSSNIDYTLTSWGVYYEDTGVSAVRIMAELKADIFATDTVLFQINYRPKNKGNATDVTAIGEDTVKCEMTRSSSDGAFWSANISDAYVKCTGTNVADRCLKESSSTKPLIRESPSKFTEVAEPQSDWKTPFVDNDANNFWCTKANTTKDAVLSPFECTALKCYMERTLTTSEADKDLNFTPTATNPDYMVIKPGRAQVYINKSTANFVNPATNDAYSTDIELEVPLGAVQLSLAALATSFLALAF